MDKPILCAKCRTPVSWMSYFIGPTFGPGPFCWRCRPSRDKAQATGTLLFVLLLLVVCWFTAPWLVYLFLVVYAGLALTSPIWWKKG